MYGISQNYYPGSPYQYSPKPQTQQGASAVSINIFEPKVINNPQSQPLVASCVPAHQPLGYNLIPQRIMPEISPYAYPTYPPYSPVNNVQLKNTIFEPAPMREIPSYPQNEVTEIPVKEPASVYDVPKASYMEPAVISKPIAEQQPIYIPPPVAEAPTMLPPVYPVQPINQQPAAVIPQLPVQPVPIAPSPLPAAASNVKSEGQDTQAILAKLPELTNKLTGADYDQKLDALNHIARLSLGSIEGDETVRKNLINTYSALVKEVMKPPVEGKDKKQADLVQQRAMFTLALLNKKHNQGVPLAELPGISQIAGVLKNSQDPDRKAAAISALKHMATEESTPVLLKIFNAKAKDEKEAPKVKIIAQEAYDEVIKMTGQKAS